MHKALLVRCGAVFGGAAIGGAVLLTVVGIATASRTPADAEVAPAVVAPVGPAAPPAVAPAAPAGGESGTARPAAPVVPAVPAVPVLPVIPGVPPLPSGCRDVDVVASQSGFLFGTKIYRFHQLKHWCWAKGVIYDERHAWRFEGSATACLGTVYEPNNWPFTWWRGLVTSGHFSEERAHVTNCVFHFGDWKEFYPTVRIWAHADGTYDSATSN